MLKTTETDDRKKTTLEKSNELAVRLQGGLALAEAIRLVEATKDEVSPTEYAQQLEVIAEIAINLATFIPEA